MKKGKTKYALTTILGLAGGVACIVIAISQSGDFTLFINIPSFLIIAGGTACALIMSYPASDLKTIFKVMGEAFKRTDYDLLEDIETIVHLSELARRDGLLVLENYAEECGDRFLKKGLLLIADGVSRDDLEYSLASDIYHTHRRHKTGASMIAFIARTAPALGLVGTYVGLIPMLVNLRDPEALGPLMAVELVSSFYGGFMAYVIFSPMAQKLQLKSAQEKLRQELIMEGLLAIQEGKYPRLIREDLLTYLTQREQIKAEMKKRSQRDAAAEEQDSVAAYGARESRRKGA